MRIPAGLCVTLGIVCLTLGCGGGGGGGAANPTVDLPSRVQFDGFVTNTGIVETYGGGPLTGDVEGITPGVVSRQFYTFNRAPLPAGATILSAVLRIYQEDVQGNPYTDLGVVVVDDLDYGLLLQAVHYDSVPLQANIGTLSANPTLEWKTLDVTAQARAAIQAGRDPQFRLRFSNTIFILDGQNDFASFTDAEDSCCGNAHLPVLRVTYQP